MFEQSPANPSIPTTRERLWAYLQALPVRTGENQKNNIQGQVQIEVLGREGVYQESAIYGYELEGDQFVIRAVNPEGTLVTYRSVDHNLTTFVDDQGNKYKVSFPGFDDHK